MTKFRITYMLVALPVSDIEGRSAIVALPCTTVEQAAQLIAHAGGFRNEIATGQEQPGAFIAAGAVLEIRLMES